jgi:glycosyltransferase involved in cell wall biosynthesis
MDAVKEYPRVLIVSRTEISETNSQGAALGNWFRDWPRDRLAHMYSSPEVTTEPFCGHNYLLTGRERRCGKLFDGFKYLAGRGGGAPKLKPDPAARQNPTWVGRRIRTLQRWGWKGLVDTGLYDIAFPVRLSPELMAWIADFRPDVVFAFITDLGYTQFALLLHDRLGIPVCLDIVDDWPNTHSRGTVLGRWIWPVVDRAFRQLLARSTICLTIGKEMERDYRSRYPGKFEALMCCDQPQRHLAAETRRKSPKDEITIAYCGNLGMNRWKTFLDLLDAVNGLRANGMNIGVNLYSTDYPPEAADAMRRYDWLRSMPTPPHDELPGILKGSDILFHSECFDEEFRDYVRLSISSKSQVYMIAGKPILVYGPPGVGVVNYAKEYGWAYVVDQPDRKVLQDAVLRLATDRDLCGKLVDAANKTFYANHDAATVREHLRGVLAETAADVQSHRA